MLRNYVAFGGRLGRPVVVGTVKVGLGTGKFIQPTAAAAAPTILERPEGPQMVSRLILNTGNGL